MVIADKTKFFDKEGLTYKIVELIGSGAFGNVYKIIREKDKQIFALKTISSEFKDEKALKAFSHESKVAAKLNHQNIIKYYYVHDGSEYNDLPPYIIMEFANQGTLLSFVDGYIKEKKFLDNELLLKVFKELIEGMKAINKFLIHRDIKPDNILLKDGTIKISDFGLSKIVLEQTRNSTFKGFGHIRYMPPEGWRFEKNTIQMDIYSMGIVFYQLATLQYPYSVKNNHDPILWKDAHFFQNPTNPNTINQNLTPIIGQTILKMLQKNVNNRFGSWQEIEEALQKETLPKTQFTPIVENLLSKRLQVDTQESEKALKTEKRQNEIKEHYKLVNYQFKESIYNPIKTFIDEFND